MDSCPDIRERAVSDFFLNFGQELGCVLASEPFSPDVPTVVLSLLPYAVLHNATHHPVCIAAVSPRGETTPVATARPDGHVAFSWPSASPDGRPRRVRRAKIGLSFGLGDRRGDLSASLGGAPEAKARGGAEAGESGPLEGGAEEAFVWSSPVSLDEGGIHEGSVWVPAGDLVAECCFLVRIENVR